MANEASVGFAFDPSAIMAGAQKAVGAIESINSRVRMASNVALGYLGMRGLAGALPELGKTASIAGDIIQRNLFWPLRQELAPILNKFLAWVRDSRAMFVRWGGYLVGVFRIIKGVIESVLGLMQRIAKTFSDFVEDAFGKITNKIGTTMNLLLGKIAIIVAFIMVALEPLADAIGKIFGFLYVGIVRFFQGLSSQIGPLLAEVHDLFKVYGELIDEILGSSEVINGFGNLMYRLGQLVGAALRVVVLMMKTAVTGVRDLIRWFKEVFAYITSAKSIPEGILRTIESIFIGIWRAIKWVVEGLSSMFTKFGEIADSAGLNWLGDAARAIGSAFEWLGKQISKVVDRLKTFFHWVAKLMGFVEEVDESKAIADAKKDLGSHAASRFDKDPTLLINAKKTRDKEVAEARRTGKAYKSSLPEVVQEALDVKYGKVDLTYNVNMKVTEGSAPAAAEKFATTLEKDARAAVKSRRAAIGATNR